MFKVNTDLSIEITRGDAVEFIVTAQENGENYVFKSGDIVRFKVFEKKGCDCVVLQKDFGVESDTEEVTIVLEEADTKIGELIHKPKDYWYEVELNPDTLPYTIIGYDADGAKVFKLYPEGRDLGADPITPEDIPFVDKELDMTSHNPVENRAITIKFNTVEESVNQNATNIQAHTAEINNLKNTNTLHTNSINDNATAIKNHANNKENPHGVTATQVGAVPTSRTVNGKSLEGNITLSASDVGARPNTWMPTASDVGAPTMDYAQKVGAPHNLLDNSNFTNIVNQRNVTSSTLTTGQYFWDRWRCISGAITWDANGAVFADGATIQQRIPYRDDLVGAKVTFVWYYADGSIEANTTTLTASGTNFLYKNIAPPTKNKAVKYIALYVIQEDLVMVEYIIDCRQDYQWLIR